MMTMSTMYVANNAAVAKNTRPILEAQTVSEPYGPAINLVVKWSPESRKGTLHNQPSQYILSMGEKEALDLIRLLAGQLEVLRDELATKWMTY